MTPEELAEHQANRAAEAAACKKSALQLAIQNLVEEVDVRTNLHGMSVMDALIDFVETHGDDVEEAASLVKRSKYLKARLAEEARELRLLVDDDEDESTRSPDVTCPQCGRAFRPNGMAMHARRCRSRVRENAEDADAA